MKLVAHPACEPSAKNAFGKDTVFSERTFLRRARRLVLKVGTSTLSHASGELNLGVIEHLAREISDLDSQGQEVLLVTSGAVGAGMGRLGRKNRTHDLSEKQALAAVGQGVLMHIYEKFFAEYGKVVAQVLLTREDFDNGPRAQNSRSTLLRLLDWGVIPVINENDTVAVEEIQLGDNDTLSAMVATLVGADLLLILSDVDGLYTADPRREPGARLLDRADLADLPVISAGGSGSDLGTGGMVTKLTAARLALAAGVPMVLAGGSRPGIIREVMAGERIGTLFLNSRGVDE
ncbi:MAG: glutamate 5-kinase [Firmicutes bacterium]|nr:glutamate 5-kinase [Bacillota bacterium]